MLPAPPLCSSRSMLGASQGCSRNIWTEYAEAVEPSGIIRYNLNQLRSDSLGTVSGRFSSSDINIQQVFADDHQEGVVAELPIRELFLPEQGKRWVSADASQVEFRLFAHCSKDAGLIKAYKENPLTDFHQEVANLTGLKRGLAKNLNFGRLYGMGLEKMVRFMQAAQPELEREAIEEMYKSYDKLFPAAKRLAADASKTAQERGWVKTYLGRRRRFSAERSSHAALNAIIQGTAADLMKLKLLELYDTRKEPRADDALHGA